MELYGRLAVMRPTRVITLSHVAFALVLDGPGNHRDVRTHVNGVRYMVRCRLLSYEVLHRSSLSMLLMACDGHRFAEHWL